jgi:hypothetical protein
MLFKIIDDFHEAFDDLPPTLVNKYPKLGHKRICRRKLGQSKSGNRKLADTDQADAKLGDADDPAGELADGNDAPGGDRPGPVQKYRAGILDRVSLVAVSRHPGLGCFTGKISQVDDIE